VLRCIRDDGSVTWQKQERHAAFFALHDLTHFAVESVLDFRRGFFGLIAEGWEIEDTTGKGSRGPLPDEAKLVEWIVGTLDSERASGEVWSAEEFNRHLPIPSTRVLTDQDLARVRERRAELFAQWHAVKPGETLSLDFPSKHVHGSLLPRD
jgi:hypothetical protein